MSFRTSPLPTPLHSQQCYLTVLQFLGLPFIWQWKRVAGWCGGPVGKHPSHPNPIRYLRNIRPLDQRIILLQHYTFTSCM